MLAFVLVCMSGCSCSQEPAVKPEPTGTVNMATAEPVSVTPKETATPAPSETAEPLAEGPEQGELLEDEVYSTDPSTNATMSPESESTPTAEPTYEPTPSPTPFWGGGVLELPEDDFGD